MSLSFGRFNIPPIIFSLFIVYILFYIILFFIQREKEKRKIYNNILSNIFFTSILVWKLSPLITSFSTVKSNPISILYLSSGTFGVITALLFAILYTGFIFYKNKDNQFLKILCITYIVLTATTFLIISSIEPENLKQSVIDEISNLPIEFELDNNKVTIINFWATWCGPCKAEIPELINFYEEHADKINFYAVNLTNTEKSDITNFVKNSGINFPIYLDKTGAVSDYFEVESIPTTVIIFKKDGKIYLKKHGGVITSSMLEGFLP